MGCDIHVRLETKGSDGKWSPCEVYVKDEYRDPDEPEFRVLDVYHDRDYELFSALCGVRDYSESGRPSISEPRGIPTAATEESLSYLVTQMDADGHSHSWNTMAELYKYQENNSTVNRSGMISPDDAKQLDEEGIKPTGWCQGTSDLSWVKRSWVDDRDVMGALIKAIEAQVRRVRYIWRARERAEDIRILYCFDN